RADVCYEVKAPRGGYITHMNTEQCGIASVALGAGRASKEASIDYSAGIILCKKVGDKLTEGDVVARLYTSKEAMAREAEKVLLAAITISDEKPNVEKLIYARVTKD
ncbi:MAG: thymidine phosphorylase, partial [Hydrogenoanaerobacterium sp.]